MSTEKTIDNIASATGMTEKEVSAGLSALREIMIHTALNLDTIAIPAFGRFEAEKHDETVVTDRSSGKQLMLPPEITLTFKAGSSLRKRVLV